MNEVILEPKSVLLNRVILILALVMIVGIITKCLPRYLIGLDVLVIAIMASVRLVKYETLKYSIVLETVIIVNFLLLAIIFFFPRYLIDSLTYSINYLP